MRARCSTQSSEASDAEHCCLTRLGYFAPNQAERINRRKVKDRRLGSGRWKRLRSLKKNGLTTNHAFGESYCCGFAQRNRFR